MLIRRMAILVVLASLPSMAVSGICANAGGVKPIVCGNARFEVLTPTLVRMEYSPSAKFVDAPSVSVIKRDWPSVKFTAREDGGWLIISTGKMSVRYKIGRGEFTADNLLITWQTAGKHSWKPGDKDDGNLFGIPPTMDGCTKPVTPPGALSRNGYFLLDDSRSPVWDKKVDWIEARSEKGNQDWYFFVYGRDYAHCLGELARLLGPIPMVRRYTLGAWFSSRAGYSDNGWKLIVQRFREESLPLDVICLDSDSSAKIIWAGYDWDPEQMPHPKEFLSWMQGARDQSVQKRALRPYHACQHEPF